MKSRSDHRRRFPSERHPNETSVATAITVAAQWIARRTNLRPSLAIVLGSGFQDVAKRIRTAVELSCSRLPEFPQPGVGGHPGKLLVGHLAGVPVLVLNGRAHYYEGHSMEKVTFPVRVLAEFGIRELLLTNAAGAIRRTFRPGDFMRIEDHINLMSVNPLRGNLAPGRPRFVDLTRAYDPQLGQWLDRAAARLKLRWHRGVYVAVAGPSYETPAEIRAFARLGADAVGMSTVPEVIVARQCGLRVAALSCLANRAAGLGRKPLTHQDVLATGERVAQQAADLIEAFAQLYAKNIQARIDHRRVGRARTGCRPVLAL